MKNTGRIFAFEKDTHRYKTMLNLVTKSGCSNIELKNADFLKINPKDAKYSNVEYALVDPSCSGSGITSRIDYVLAPGLSLSLSSNQKVTKK